MSVLFIHSGVEAEVVEEVPEQEVVAPAQVVEVRAEVALE